MNRPFHTYRFRFSEVSPSAEEIQAFLRAEEQSEEHPVNISIGKILPQLENNGNIAGGYIIKPAGALSGLDIGVQISGYMKGAEYIAIFVCTAGELFSQLADMYNKEGEYLDAYVADSIGSLTVEKTMDRIQAELEMEMNKENLKISNRYSPGYCNWPLSGQVPLFGLMEGNPVPVSLTPSCLMIPVKSVSGIIGIGKEMKKREYACRICNNKTCIYRKLISE